MISPEEFAEWRQHPVSEWVLGLMEAWADEQKNVWAESVWTAGEIDPAALAEARVRADCYRALPDTPYEDWTALEERLNDTES